MVLHHFNCTATSLASGALALTPVWCGRFLPRPVAGVMLVALALFTGVVTLNAGGQSSCGNDISKNRVTFVTDMSVLHLFVMLHTRMQANATATYMLRQYACNPIKTALHMYCAGIYMYI